MCPYPIAIRRKRERELILYVYNIKTIGRYVEDIALPYVQVEIAWPWESNVFLYICPYIHGYDYAYISLLPFGIFQSHNIRRGYHLRDYPWDNYSTNYLSPTQRHPLAAQVAADVVGDESEARATDPRPHGHDQLRLPRRQHNSGLEVQGRWTRGHQGQPLVQQERLQKASMADAPGVCSWDPTFIRRITERISSNELVNQRHKRSVRREEQNGKIHGLATASSFRDTADTIIMERERLHSFYSCSCNTLAQRRASTLEISPSMFSFSSLFQLWSTTTASFLNHPSFRPNSSSRSRRQRSFISLRTCTERSNLLLMARSLAFMPLSPPSRLLRLLLAWALLERTAAQARTELWPLAGGRPGSCLIEGGNSGSYDEVHHDSFSPFSLLCLWASLRAFELFMA
eukprot:1051687-Pleurochrysis_carterae.AAC.2